MTRFYSANKAHRDMFLCVFRSTMLRCQKGTLFRGQADYVNRRDVTKNRLRHLKLIKGQMKYNCLYSEFLISQNSGKDFICHDKYHLTFHGEAIRAVFGLLYSRMVPHI